MAATAAPTAVHREDTDDRQFVIALARGLSVLQAFGQGDDLLTNAEIAQREPGVDGAVAWERAKGQGTLFQTEALDSSIRAQAGGAEEFPLPNGKRGVLLGQAEDGAWLVREIESGLVQRVPARPGQSAFLPPGTLDDLTGGGPMPHAAAREEAWYDRMLPVLDDLQGRVERLVSQGVVRGHESLPPEVQAGVRDWLNDVSGRMSEAKRWALWAIEARVVTTR